MKIIGIIPARFASTRFPGKPLVSIDGISMIQRVYQQCLKSSSLSDVYVATDDDRIYNHVLGFGGKVIMTSDQHRSGTDRCAEVVTKINTDADVVINIQGDEPFITPDQIDKVASCFSDENISIATLGKIIHDTAELLNSNVVKVLQSKEGKALYFSRSAIPHLRGIAQENWVTTFTFLKHIGIYAYKTEVLKKIVQLPASPLELAESLEQLRWLENGYSIGLALTETESIAIDTPEDLSKVKNLNL